jgi:hypothetical protein
MVGLVIAFPAMVMHYKSGPVADPSKIEITLPPFSTPGAPFNPGVPQFNLPGPPPDLPKAK